jgi:S-adenosylmethionine synthetase
MVRESFPLTPAGIIESLDLLRPMYERTAVYGHFGREDEGFPWEKRDRVDSLRALAT